MISYQVAKRSVLGTREEQQDYAIVREQDNNLLAVVCDGMGGLKHGGAASALAANELISQYEKKCEDESIIDFFFNVVDILDESVCALTNSKNSDEHAGTTIVAAYIKNNYLNWLSVGDSRLYIVRGKEIVQATRDHNYQLKLDEMLKDNLISGKDYERENQRGESLISFIGMSGIEIMDLNRNPFNLQVGDYILITTDGLFKILPDNLIGKIVINSKDVEEAAETLIKESITQCKGEQDNTTFILIHIVESN